MTRSQPEPLILASHSPRRRELLAAAGYRFQVLPADESVESNQAPTADPHQLPLILAAAKGQAVAATVQLGVILAADTIAICNHQILGKPAHQADARGMLQFLAGREHLVLTGVYLIDAASRAEVRHLECTRLRMDPLSDSQIDAYLATNLWRGKAGAFGYQDGWDWLHVLEGSPSNVVGLPVEALPQLFRELEAKITEISDRHAPPPS